MQEKYFKTTCIFGTYFLKNICFSFSNKITIEDIKSIINIISTSHMIRFKKKDIHDVLYSPPSLQDRFSALPYLIRQAIVKLSKYG